MGQTLCTIDSKGRININRSITNVEPNERLAIIVKKKYLEILKSEVIVEKYEELYKLANNASSLEEYTRIDQKINELLFSVTNCSVTDKQCRILLPPKAFTETSIKKGTQVLCVGRGKSLRIYNPQEFADYVSKHLPHN